MVFERLHEELLKKRKLYLYGEINDDTMYDSIQQISFLAGVNKKPIYILIHSEGGDMDCMEAIIDEMIAVQAQNIPVVTVNIGVAYSAAAIILAMGSKGLRYARPNSSIMLHPCSLTMPTDYHDNQAACMKHYEKKIVKWNTIIAEACGKKNSKSFAQDIDKGLWMTSEEAIKYGVIDGIWDKPLFTGGLYEKSRKQ